MERLLRKVRGKFVLSLNDLAEARKLFRRLKIEKTEVAYTARTDSGKRYGELLINFKARRRRSTGA